MLGGRKERVLAPRTLHVGIVDGPVPQEEAEDADDGQVLRVGVSSFGQGAGPADHDGCAHVLAAVRATTDEHEDASDEVGDENGEEEEP
jgi:hypothetical protein